MDGTTGHFSVQLAQAIMAFLKELPQANSYQLQMFIIGWFCEQGLRIAGGESNRSVSMKTRDFDLASMGGPRREASGRQ